MKLQGKTAVITGSSCGVGRAIAIEFARQGAKVICCARREERLSQAGSGEQQHHDDQECGCRQSELEPAAKLWRLCCRRVGQCDRQPGPHKARLLRIAAKLDRFAFPQAAMGASRLPMRSNASTCQRCSSEPLGTATTARSPDRRRIRCENLMFVQSPIHPITQSPNHPMPHGTSPAQRHRRADRYR